MRSTARWSARRSPFLTVAAASTTRPRSAWPALTNGSHALTSVATDNAGNTSSSAGVSFTIGSGPATVVVTVPPDWTFASKIVPVTAIVTGGTPPLVATLLVDGVATAVVPTVAGTTYTFAWDTSSLSDGSHTIQVSVRDANNLSSSSVVLHQTVDNTPATAVMYQPTLANLRNNGPTTFQVHASDAFGVKSVQFTVGRDPGGRAADRAGRRPVLPVHDHVRHLDADGRLARDLGGGDRPGGQRRQRAAGHDHDRDDQLPAGAQLPRDQSAGRLLDLRPDAGRGGCAAGLSEGERLPVGHARAVPAVARRRGHRRRQAGADHGRRRDQGPAWPGIRCCRSTASRR